MDTPELPKLPQQSPLAPILKRPRPKAALQYPFAPPESDGGLVELASGVLWGRISMPIALDHINIYLLRDEDAWIIVDTGLHTEHSKQTWEKFAQHEKLQGLPFKAVFCTHYHYDHAGLAKWLGERFSIPLYMSRAEYYYTKLFYHSFPEPTPIDFTMHHHRLGLDEEMLAKIVRILRLDPLMPDGASLFYHRLRKGQVWRIGQHNWEVLIGAGHSPEHVCLFSPAQNEHPPILISGDQLLPRISSNIQVHPAEPDSDSLAVWLDSLTMLEQLPETTMVLPSHQDVFIGSRERCQELKAHHDIQLHQILQILCQKNLSACQLMKEIFPKLRNPVDVLLAIGETAAHLNWLWHRSYITRNLDEHGVFQYCITQKYHAIDEKKQHSPTSVLRVSP